MFLPPSVHLFVCSSVSQLVSLPDPIDLFLSPGDLIGSDFWLPKILLGPNMIVQDPVGSMFGHEPGIL